MSLLILAIRGTRASEARYYEMWMARFKSRNLDTTSTAAVRASLYGHNFVEQS